MNKIKATFADGEVKFRSTLHKVYTHGWRIRYSYADEDAGERRNASRFGFAASATLAHKAAAREIKEGGPHAVRVIAREVVPVEAI